MNNQFPKSLARPVQCLYGIALERDESKFKSIDDSKSICYLPLESKEHYTCMNDTGLPTIIIEEKEFLIIGTLSTGGMIS